MLVHVYWFRIFSNGLAFHFTWFCLECTIVMCLNSYNLKLGRQEEYTYTLGHGTVHSSSLFSAEGTHVLSVVCSLTYLITWCLTKWARLIISWSWFELYALTDSGNFELVVCVCYLTNSCPLNQSCNTSNVRFYVILFRLYMIVLASVNGNFIRIEFLLLVLIWHTCHKLWLSRSLSLELIT